VLRNLSQVLLPCCLRNLKYRLVSSQKYFRFHELYCSLSLLLGNGPTVAISRARSALAARP